MIGKTISHYRILEKLGEGGMGVVYKAEDSKLDRMVALKFLAPQALGGEDEKVRFVHEAKAAGALSHPNICTVFEIDEAEGDTFIAMECVEGESLKDRIEAGSIGLVDALDIAIAIAEGLQEAHDNGVVHRDIKPANVMLTAKGQVKIMDFGLAKSTKGVVVTKSGTTLGTVAYMSPEQARGQEVDHRTDIWSLGVVLYELATGQKPFKGDYEHAVVYSILNQDPESTRTLCPGLPAELERIVRKALAKKVGERYQHAADFLVDLKSLREVIKASAAGSLLRRRRLSGSRRIVLYAAVGVLLIALGAFKMGLFKDVATKIDSVAVLPLKNLSGEPEQDYFADGMTEALIADLAKIGSLKVISRTSVMRYNQTDRSLPDIARELNVDAIVEGTVLRAGDRVRITAQLIEGKTDQHLWAESYERDLQDILALQSEVARAIAEEIEVKLSSSEQVQLGETSVVDPRAYEAYLMGRYHWNQRNEKTLLKSIEYYQTALEIDPDYALAYVGLAEAYIVLADWNFAPAKEAYPKARELARKALEYDEDLAEAHTALADVKYMYDWDWPAAYRGFQRAIKLKPNYATAHQWYAECLCAAGKYDEALREIDRAIELDPFSLIMLTMKANMLHTAGRLDEALDEFQRVLEMDPDFLGAHLLLSFVYLSENMCDEAVEELAKSEELLGTSEEELIALRKAYEISGIAGVSQWQLVSYETISQEGYVNPIEVALSYARSNDMDRAFEWLERGCEERSALMAWITVDPRFDIMRSDPRFDALVEKMELKF